MVLKVNCTEQQPSFVKLLRLSTHSSALLFRLPFPPPSSSSRAPSFLRIGHAELILSQLLQGLLVVAFVAPSEAERSSSPLCSCATASPSISDKIWGGGGYYPVDAYRWPPGPSLNAGPLHLPCFSLATIKLAWMVIQYGWTMSEQMNRAKQILNVKVKGLLLFQEWIILERMNHILLPHTPKKHRAARSQFSSHLNREKCLKRWASSVTLNHQFHCVLVTSTRTRKIGSSPFKRRRSPVSQMAGWDFDTFCVFLSIQSWETLWHWRRRGEGLCNSMGLFLSRKPRVPLAACLWPLIRAVTGGDVFLSFLIPSAHNYALYFTPKRYNSDFFF